MTGSRFFDPPTALSVAEIVDLTGAQAPAGADLAKRVVNIAPLDLAGPDDLSYVESNKYLDRLKATRAGVCLVTARFASEAPAHVLVLVSRNPPRDFTVAARKMHAAMLKPWSQFGGSGVSAGATVHPTARIDSGATIDPGAVVGPGAQIGPGTVIGCNAVIGPQVRIGAGCAVGANCTIAYATIGDRVIVHPGCHIGQDGFGYVPTAQGHLKVPQVGGVTIGDDVEIGAGTAIDRGGLRDTTIGNGCKIDNLVQIGHNVVIGQHCILAGQSGVAGSVTIGDFAMLGGGVGVAPHVTIGKGAKVAGGSGLMRDVPPGQTYGGYPAVPQRQWLRHHAALNQLATRGKPIDSPPIGGAGDSEKTSAD